MLIKDYNLKIIKEFRNAKVAQVELNPEISVVIATSNYIPMNEFKQIFDFVDELSSQHTIRKVIFDKRNLTVFHQPSMEWYFIDWKERMYEKGCRAHRKILPDDKIFVKSVQIGRDKLIAEYPDRKFHQMDIQYADSLEEAIEN
ncbi:MAG: hypothetical protein ACOCXH_09575 [Cyclobacteriaceae bacterium]